MIENDQAYTWPSRGQWICALANFVLRPRKAERGIWKCRALIQTFVLPSVRPRYDNLPFSNCFCHYHISHVGNININIRWNFQTFVLPSVRPRYVVSALRFLVVDQLISNLHTSNILGISSLSSKLAKFEQNCENRSALRGRRTKLARAQIHWPLEGHV
jgi:hypothetical protein